MNYNQIIFILFLLLNKKHNLKDIYDIFNYYMKGLLNFEVIII